MINFLKSKKYFFISLLIIFFIVVLDQYTKHWALNFIGDIIKKTNGVHNHVKKTSFFNIVLVYNSGISFGIFNDDINLIKYSLFITIFMITAVLFYISYKSKDLVYILSLSFIIGGSLGNLIDRINHGAVIDFLDFHIKDLHWPAFNIADSSILVGVFIYIIFDTLIKKNDKSTGI